MRIQKEFGHRTRKLNSDEVKSKYFLVFEGEKSEIQYFSGINDNKLQLGISPLIEIKPIMRSFEEIGWSNPKKLLDRLIEYKNECDVGTMSIVSILSKTIDFLLEDNILNCESIYSPIQMRDKLCEYFLNEKSMPVDTEVTEIEEFTNEVILSLSIVFSINAVIKDLSSYIEGQRILYDKEVDSICLIVDRDKESFVNNPGNNQYRYVLDNCIKNDIKFYLTNPCFEFWLLMHFEEVKGVDKEMLLENPKISGKRRYAEVELKKVVTEYNKNNIKFDNFLPRIELAVENEKYFCEDVDLLEDNVGSNIGLLIRELINKHN
ncbi:MAG: abortive phage resistance protein [Firmicutes bacterium HGW-Firmicutes-2]|jgi:hypothetical protein|nr:MAG: abortive phage resistance protein [Firmicutes bacterium HGW-Firmicutes-2]